LTDVTNRPTVCFRAAPRAGGRGLRRGQGLSPLPLAQRTLWAREGAGVAKHAEG